MFGTGTVKKIHRHKEWRILLVRLRVISWIESLCTAGRSTKSHEHHENQILFSLIHGTNERLLVVKLFLEHRHQYCRNTRFPRGR
jgi:hypothetical protein